MNKDIRLQAQERIEIKVVDEKVIAIDPSGREHELSYNFPIDITPHWELALSFKGKSVQIRYIGYTKHEDARLSFANPAEDGLIFLWHETEDEETSIFHFGFKFRSLKSKLFKENNEFIYVKPIMSDNRLLAIHSRPENPVVGFYINRQDLLYKMNGIFPGYETNITFDGRLTYLFRTNYFFPFLIVEYQDGSRGCYVYSSIDLLTQEKQLADLVRI